MVMGKVFSEHQKNQILERDGYLCAYCGDAAYEVDHILPKSKGGQATFDNGVAVCERCNRRKGNKLDLLMLTRGFFIALGGEDGNGAGYKDSKRHSGISEKSRLQPETIRHRPKRRQSTHQPLGTRASLAKLGTGEQDCRTVELPSKPTVQRPEHPKSPELMPFIPRIRNAVGYWRRNLRMTDKELAKKAGIKLIPLQLWENDLGLPSLEQMEDIGVVLGKPIN